MKDWDRFEWMAFLAFIGLLLSIPSMWVLNSYMESKTYNKLTGAHTTTWDAMWVELRVQDKPMEPK